MKIKYLVLLILLCFSTISINAQSTGCSEQSLKELIEAINNYRANEKNWLTVSQPEFTLAGADDEDKGIIVLPVNNLLMFSAKETSRKFADGTYPEWDHEVNGERATMRAIKDGWSPSFNKLFYANEWPPFTMVTENLYMGTQGHNWQEIFNMWKNSPGHNSAMLARGGVSIGCGCYDSKITNDSYWVLLVEMENSAMESDEIMDTYFKQGIFYKAKDNMKKSDRSKYKADEYFEFIDGALEKIRKD